MYEYEKVQSPLLWQIMVSHWSYEAKGAHPVDPIGFPWVDDLIPNFLKTSLRQEGHPVYNLYQIKNKGNSTWEHPNSVHEATLFQSSGDHNISPNCF